MFVLKRKPTTLGDILSEEFLKPLDLSQKQVGRHLGCDIKVVNRIVNGRTSITTEMALKLGAAFGTSPDFWLNAQTAMDVYRASRKLRSLPKRFRTSARAAA